MYSRIEIGQIDCDNVKTIPVDNARVSSERKESGGHPPFIIQLSSAGTDGDGVAFEIHHANQLAKDKPVCVFYVPDNAWKTFVEAVKCINIMRDADEL